VSKHSPTPWTVTYGGTIKSTDGKTIAHCPVYDAVSLAERNGNARLLVAAPDLLAALEAITPHAIGHSKPDCKGRKRDPENCEVCKAIWAARDAIAKALGTEPQP
jgi:hypothetical protein